MSPAPFSFAPMSADERDALTYGYDPTRKPDPKYNAFPLSSNVEDRRDELGPLGHILTALSGNTPEGWKQTLRGLVTAPMTPAINYDYPWLVNKSSPPQMSVDAGFGSIGK